MIKCCIIGKSGKMAQECLRYFESDSEFEVVNNFNSQHPVSVSALQNSSSQLVIDCSLGSVFLENLEFYLKAKQAVLVVSSGWYEHLSVAHELVKKYSGKVFYADNYAIGSYLFKIIIEQTCKYLNHLDFDVSLLEKHHTHKKDYPSAVAQKIGQIVLASMHQKKQVQSFPSKEISEIKNDTFYISSNRVGSNTIEHEFYIASDSEDLKICHSIRDRKAFMQGIKESSQFLLTQDSGIFNMQNLLNF